MPFRIIRRDCQQYLQYLNEHNFERFEREEVALESRWLEKTNHQKRLRLRDAEEEQRQARGEFDNAHLLTPREAQQRKTEREKAKGYIDTKRLNQFLVDEWDLDVVDLGGKASAAADSKKHSASLADAGGDVASRTTGEGDISIFRGTADLDPSNGSPGASSSLTGPPVVRGKSSNSLKRIQSIVGGTSSPNSLATKSSTIAVVRSSSVVPEPPVQRAPREELWAKVLGVGDADAEGAVGSEQFFDRPDLMFCDPVDQRGKGKKDIQSGKKRRSVVGGGASHLSASGHYSDSPSTLMFEEPLGELHEAHFTRSLNRLGGANDKSSTPSLASIRNNKSSPGSPSGASRSEVGTIRRSEVGTVLSLSRRSGASYYGASYYGGSSASTSLGSTPTPTALQKKPSSYYRGRHHGEESDLFEASQGGEDEDATSGELLGQASDLDSEGERNRVNKQFLAQMVHSRSNHHVLSQELLLRNVQQHKDAVLQLAEERYKVKEIEHSRKEAEKKRRTQKKNLLNGGQSVFTKTDRPHSALSHLGSQVYAAIPSDHCQTLGALARRPDLYLTHGNADIYSRGLEARGKEIRQRSTEEQRKEKKRMETADRLWIQEQSQQRRRQQQQSKVDDDNLLAGSHSGPRRNKTKGVRLLLNSDSATIDPSLEEEGLLRLSTTSLLLSPSSNDDRRSSSGFGDQMLSMSGGGEGTEEGTTATAQYAATTKSNPYSHPELPGQTPGWELAQGLRGRLGRRASVLQKKQQSVTAMVKSSPLDDFDRTCRYTSDGVREPKKADALRAECNLAVARIAQELAPKHKKLDQPRRQYFLRL